MKKIVLNSLLKFYNPFLMTKQEVSIVIVQMHTIALTITEKATISTLSLTGPLTITKYLKTFFPHFHKIIFINIALMEITANAGTRRDRTICQEQKPTLIPALQE